MYHRKSLDPSFGPHEVSIGISNITLKDGCKLSVKFWFPGPDRPFQNVEWTKYCDSAQDYSDKEVICKLTFLHILTSLP